jgi:FkbM family methyltransferase
MNRLYRGFVFHLKRILFEKFAIPKVRNENISKVSFKKYLPKNPIIIDCGAHDGADTVQLAKTFKGTVHAFEPVDAIFKRLQNRAKNFANVFCYQIALSDTNGTQKFYVSEGESDGSSSLLEPQDHLKDHPDTYFNETITVTTLTLDAWAESNNIKHVDLLWLDMQGFELNMLKASKIILPTVKVIHTEISVTETYKGVPTYEAYKQFLESIGFVVETVAIPNGWDMGNVLFVRK